jgi:hypothetical protein
LPRHDLEDRAGAPGLADIRGAVPIEHDRVRAAVVVGGERTGGQPHGRELLDGIAAYARSDAPASHVQVAGGIERHAFPGSELGADQDANQRAVGKPPLHGSALERDQKVAAAKRNRRAGQGDLRGGLRADRHEENADRHSERSRDAGAHESFRLELPE